MNYDIYYDIMTPENQLKAKRNYQKWTNHNNYDTSMKQKIGPNIPIVSEAN